MAKEKVIVTQAMLDLNPGWVGQGIKIGDEVELGPNCDEDGNVIPEEGDGSVTTNDIGPGPLPTNPPGTK